jgi:hypothetical protein
MAILQKVPAPKLELNANSLPPISAAINTALRLAIRVGGMNRLNNEAQFVAHHAEKKYDTLLVNRGVAKPTEIDRLPELRGFGLRPIYGSAGGSHRSWWGRNLVIRGCAKR